MVADAQLVPSRDEDDVSEQQEEQCSAEEWRNSVAELPVRAARGPHAEVRVEVERDDASCPEMHRCCGSAWDRSRWSSMPGAWARKY